MEIIILFAPLVGALLCGFGWRLFGETAAMWIATGSLFLSALLSWIVFLTFDGVTEQIQILRWIESGSLSADWAVRLDRLTAIMLIVITTVSSLVHLYSFGYMNNDPQWKAGESYKPRFFAYLSFFTFAMLMLVTSDNLLQMFFGWEGVGVASYLLIGFYYRKPSANAAAIKAFVVNRVGDFGFALGIFGLFFLTDSIHFDHIFAAVPTIAETQITFLWRDWNAANLIAVLLFIGAMGKSAQLFLHTWLPDAMEGPTPVSALIHAATMVTAGVFLVCRMSPLMEVAEQATIFITVIGATTAFVAASIGLVQSDIKRVIAYSTMSQLGYMFVAAGVGMYSAAMFHLFTHAFFKAMLFLGAGSIIHSMHHDQDMNNYGGLRKKIPYTFAAMMIGTLAITGVGIPLTHFGFAGFLSKDAIVESAYAGGSSYGFWLLVAAAAMTSFYSWRLMFLTFYGEARGDKYTHQNAHESPLVMLIPLGVLSLGAIFSGMIWYGSFFGHTDEVAKFYGIPYTEDVTYHSDGQGKGHTQGNEKHVEEGANEKGSHYFFIGKPGQGALYFSPDNKVLGNAHALPNWVKISPFFAMIFGLIMALWFYIWSPSLPARLAENQRPLYLFLKNKWYFDELYNVIFVKPTFWIARQLWKKGDGDVIDGSLNGLAMGFIPFITRLTGRAQSGYIFTYAFAMVIGIVVLVTWMTLSGGAH
ncbi:MAG: NADH-quinone oxidoreductase subunit L [Tateyamaria sp.]|jgi:NADH-quinone oxidoreductase subunit L|nr:NADH-quinone oxidoreductase subunit L [Tateyamaria sp.]